MVRRHGGIGLLFYIILVATGYVSPLIYLVSKMTPVGVLTVEINYLVRGVIRLSSDVSFSNIDEDVLIKCGRFSIFKW